MALTDKLTAIADAIRGKTGKSDSMTLDQMPTEIAGIVTGGGGSSQPITGTFTATGANYTLTHNCGLDNYLLVVKIDEGSIETLKTSTATINTIFLTGIYSGALNLSSGEYSYNMANRKNVRYLHGTQKTANDNTVTRTDWTANASGIGYCVAGCTYHYTIYKIEV